MLPTPAFIAPVRPTWATGAGTPQHETAFCLLIAWCFANKKAPADAGAFEFREFARNQ
jgi:hypothetical protein